MRGLLINPPTDMQYLSIPPLNLISLASMIKDEHEVSILDAKPRKLSIKKIVKKVKGNYDFIGIPCGYTYNVNNIIKLGKKIKEKYPDTVLISGGDHATFDYKNLLENGFDYIVRNEGELTFQELINFLGSNSNKEPRKIKGIAFKQGNKIRVTPDRPFIKNLDDTSFPDWDLIDKNLYNTDFGLSGAIETSRGCSFNCSFCSSKKMWGGWRFKSANRVVKEFRWAEDNGFKFLYFADLSSCIDAKRMISICKKLIEQKNKIVWCTGPRTDIISKYPSLIKLMRESNCRGFMVAYESMSDTILKKMGKGTTAEMNREALEVLRKNDVLCLGGFVFGTPGETKEEVQKTIDFSFKTDLPTYGCLRPYPGNEFWQEDYCQLYPYFNQAYCFLHENPKMIKSLIIRAALQFYLKPKSLKRLFSKDRFERGWTRLVYKQILQTGKKNLLNLCKGGL